MEKNIMRISQEKKVIILEYMSGEEVYDFALIPVAEEKSYLIKLY